jgi:hypothetical protein
VAAGSLAVDRAKAAHAVEVFEFDGGMIAD